MLRLSVKRDSLTKQGISKFFEANSDSNSWQKMLNNFNLTKEAYFKWFHLVRAFPKSQKLAWLNGSGNI